MAVSSGNRRLGLGVPPTSPVLLGHIHRHVVAVDLPQPKPGVEVEEHPHSEHGNKALVSRLRGSPVGREDFCCMTQMSESGDSKMIKNHLHKGPFICSLSRESKILHTTMLIGLNARKPSLFLIQEAATDSEKGLCHAFGCPEIHCPSERKRIACISAQMFGQRSSRQFTQVDLLCVGRQVPRVPTLRSPPGYSSEAE